MQALFGRHALGRIRQCILGGLRRDLLEVFDVTLQGVGAAVEDQVLGQLAFLRIDLGVRL